MNEITVCSGNMHACMHGQSHLASLLDAAHAGIDWPWKGWVAAGFVVMDSCSSAMYFFFLLLLFLFLLHHGSQPGPLDKIRQLPNGQVIGQGFHSQIPIRRQQDNFTLNVAYLSSFLLDVIAAQV